MEPIHVLVLDTVMDRGGAEAMIMNYMRNIDRDIIKFDFLTNRDYRAAYEEKRTVLHGMPMEKIFTIREQVTKICQYP